MSHLAIDQKAPKTAIAGNVFPPNEMLEYFHFIEVLD